MHAASMNKQPFSWILDQCTTQCCYCYLMYDANAELIGRICLFMLLRQTTSVAPPSDWLSVLIACLHGNVIINCIYLASSSFSKDPIWEIHRHAWDARLLVLWQKWTPDETKYSYNVFLKVWNAHTYIGSNWSSVLTPYRCVSSFLLACACAFRVRSFSWNELYMLC